MYLPEEPEESLEMNIVPMIDVIFAILTFFIISSLFLTHANSMPVNLPKAASAEAQERSKITVTVDASGKVFLNRREISLDQLQPGVRDLMGDSASAIIIINADASVSHGQVIAVMDNLREIQGATLAIATQKSAP